MARTTAPRSALTPARQIAAFLAKYTPAMAKEARAARRALRALLPTAVEMVYDNYNALVFGYAPGARPSEAILSLAILPDHVTLCFLQGAKLDDPQGILRGAGSVVRHVRLEGGAAALGRPAIRSLMKQALARARVPLPARGSGATVIRAISVKQRPRSVKQRPRSVGQRPRSVGQRPRSVGQRPRQPR